MPVCELQVETAGVPPLQLLAGLWGAWGLFPQSIQAPFPVPSVPVHSCLCQRMQAHLSALGAGSQDPTPDPLEVPVEHVLWVASRP